MTVTTELYPSAHIAELFFPLAGDESALLHVIREIAGIGYYRGFETGIIHQPQIARTIRTLACLLYTSLYRFHEALIAVC